MERGVWLGNSGQLTPVILIETAVFEPLVTSVLITFSCTSMKPQWWHLTTGPVTVSVMTFLAAAPRSVRDVAAALAIGTASATAQHIDVSNRRSIRPEKVTA